MPRPFALPDLGEGLTEAEIVKVLVNEGDVLAEERRVRQQPLLVEPPQRRDRLVERCAGHEAVAS